MDEEKHKLAGIINRCSRALTSKIVAPVRKGLGNIKQAIIFDRYYQGLTKIEKKGIYSMFVSGTIIKKNEGAEYLVSLKTDMGERTYSSRHLYEQYDVGQNVLLTVFVTTRDTLDYCPENKSSGFNLKQVVYSIPLEHRVVGMMKL